jgi:hypothetical protein
MSLDLTPFIIPLFGIGGSNPKGFESPVLGMERANAQSGFYTTNTNMSGAKYFSEFFNIYV